MKRSFFVILILGIASALTAQEKPSFISLSLGPGFSNPGWEPAALHAWTFTR